MVLNQGGLRFRQSCECLDENSARPSDSRDEPSADSEHGVARLFVFPDQLHAAIVRVWMLRQRHSSAHVDFFAPVLTPTQGYQGGETSYI